MQYALSVIEGPELQVPYRLEGGAVMTIAQIHNLEVKVKRLERRAEAQARHMMNVMGLLDKSAGHVSKLLDRIERLEAIAFPIE